MAAGVLKAKFGSNYEVGSAAKMLYPASGDKKTTFLVSLFNSLCLNQRKLHEPWNKYL